jgi:hypothetical protein
MRSNGSWPLPCSIERAKPGRVFFSASLIISNLNRRYSPSAPDFFEERGHRDGKAGFVTAPCMLARDFVEPAFASAGDVEIGAVDRQHAAFHHHAFPEPVRQFERHPARAFGAFVDKLGPAVEPAERRFAAVFGADIGLDRGRNQPVERLAKAHRHAPLSDAQSRARSHRA